MYSLTYCINNFGKFLQLIGTYVWTKGDPKVDDQPLAQKVLVCLLLPVVIHKVKGTAQGCLPKGPGPLSLSLCMLCRKGGELKNDKQCSEVRRPM